MYQGEHLFIFRIDSVRHAITLAMVERVIRAAEITPLPGASGIVRGIVNIHGAIVPVVDTRRMLGAPERPLLPDDIFVIVRTGQRLVALVVDGVEHVTSVPGDRITPMGELLPRGRLMTGVARVGEGMVMIHDLEQRIDTAELAAVERVLEGNGVT
jgi:purine-binding chemotaxis protein CheW